MKLSLLIVVCLAALISKEVYSQKIACRVDLAFIVDNSGSIRDTNPPGGPDNWGLVLTFIKSLLSKITIGLDDTHVALVDFGNKGYFEWDFNKYSTEAQLSAAVDALRYRGENTNMTGGFWSALDMFNNKSYGSRPDALNVGILITDGIPTFDADKLPAAVSQFKGMPARLVCVGVTQAVNTTLLKSLATSPTDYGFASDFSALDMLKDIIINNQTCQPVTTTTPPSTSTTTTTPLPTTTTTTTPTTTTVSTTTAKPTAPPVTMACNNGADIAFVIDASGSMGYQNFVKVRDFVLSIIMNLDIESGKIRASVLTISDTVQQIFSLGAYNNRLDMAKAIKTIGYPAAGANYSALLKYVREQTFTVGNGDRTDVPNTLVFIQDGGSNDQSATLSEADLTKKAGVRIICYGIGNWLNQFELQQMATSPYQTNVLTVPNFDSLNTTTAQEDIHNTICSNANLCASNPCGNGQCSQTGGTVNCNCNSGMGGTACQLTCRQVADVMFLADASGSYQPSGFQKQLDLIRSLVNGMNINPGANRVAFGIFANTGSLKFHLDDFSDKQQVLNALSVGYPGGSTNLADGLKLATTEFTTKGRSNVAKILIVLTDGQSDNINNTIAEARKVRQAGVIILVVAVGTQYSYDELSYVASSPAAANIVNVTSYDTFNTALAPLQSAICDDINECDSNPCRNGGQCVNKINTYTCTCPAGFTGVNCERPCTGKVDIAFILDASGSIRNERFPKVQDFVVSILEQFQISPQDTQVAAVTYSDSYVHQFFLNDYNNKQDVEVGIRRAQFIGGRTNSAAALRYTADTIFSPAHGDRADAPNYIFFLSDGNSNINAIDTVPAAIHARELGITLIPFAVGTDVNLFELRNVASEPYSKTIFAVNSSIDFPSIKDGMINAVCDSVNECASSPCQNGGQCQPSPLMYTCACQNSYSGERCERRCPAQMDVSVVMDLSGSLEEVYNIVIEAAKQIIYGLPVAGGAARVSVSTYADNATINFPLNAYSTAQSLRYALAFSKAGGTTNTQAAIKLSYTSVFTADKGDRNGVDNYMIILTDGQSNVNSQNTLPEAKNAQQRGIKVYTVGIGESAYKPEIEGMATDPATSHTVYIKDAASVSAGASQLLDLLCQ